MRAEGFGALSRSDPCHCGSGESYGGCHMAQDPSGWRCTLCGRNRRDDQDCPHPRMKTLGHTAADTLACDSRGCMAQARVAVLDELGGRVKVFCDGHRARATWLYRSLLREQLKLPRRVWARVVDQGKWHEGVLLRCHRIRTRCGKTEKIRDEPRDDEPRGDLCGTCRRWSRP